MTKVCETCSSSGNKNAFNNLFTTRGPLNSWSLNSNKRWLRFNCNEIYNSMEYIEFIQTSCTPKAINILYPNKTQNLTCFQSCLPSNFRKPLPEYGKKCFQTEQQQCQQNFYRHVMIHQQFCLFPKNMFDCPIGNEFNGLKK